jgi:hypothetical protein
MQRLILPKLELGVSGAEEIMGTVLTVYISFAIVWPKKKNRSNGSGIGSDRSTHAEAWGERNRATTNRHTKR